jgi:DnaJ-class molecular chaperone
MMIAWLIAAVFVVFLGWLIDLRWHPMRRCPRCDGAKTSIGSSRERWGTCGRCGGEGEVRRFGAPRAER